MASVGRGSHPEASWPVPRVRWQVRHRPSAVSVATGTSAPAVRFPPGSQSDAQRGALALEEVGRAAQECGGDRGSHGKPRPTDSFPKASCIRRKEMFLSLPRVPGVARGHHTAGPVRRSPRASCLVPHLPPFPVASRLQGHSFWRMETCCGFIPGPMSAAGLSADGIQNSPSPQGTSVREPGTGCQEVTSTGWWGRHQGGSSEEGPTKCLLQL